MPDTKLIQVGGWKSWYYPATRRANYNTASAPFPTTYLPTTAFWTDIMSDHCLLRPPWSYLGSRPIDVFTETGGTTSLVGAIAGLGATQDRLNQPNSASWGIGRTQYMIPEVGYCIGDRYKEHSYFTYSVLNLEIENIIQGNAYIDVFQRSRLKRTYVGQGVVKRFTVNPTEPRFVLSLDIDEGDFPSGSDVESPVGDTIKVYIPYQPATDTTAAVTERKIELTILKVLPNWELSVSEPPSSGNGLRHDPKSGYFYELVKPWMIEDPYLISGFYQGAQGQVADAPKSPDSPYRVYKTDQNKAYNEVKFVGAYVYFNKPDNMVTLAAPGTPMSETTSGEWKWIYMGGYSAIYKDTKDRYAVINDPDVSSEVAQAGEYVSPSIRKYLTASEGDLASWKQKDGVTYVRMELDKGGNSGSNNWHSPILSKCWLEQNGNFFTILAQPEGNIIDVSLKDVTNKVDLNVNAGIINKIFNQYAWIINEHYSTYNGFLEGEITSASYNQEDGTTKITFENTTNSYGTVVQNTSYDIPNLNPNSFYNRFIKKSGNEGGSGIALKKVWKKYDHWYVYDETHSFFRINPDTVTIQATDVDTTAPKATCSVTIYGNMSQSKFAGFYFDTPYKRTTSQLIPSLDFEFQQAIDNALPTICVFTNYRSAAISIPIPTGTMVGITGGTWWGFGIQGMDAVSSPNYCPLFITVPLANRGVSSFYHHLCEQDWVFFQDVDTKKITLRTGNVNFMDIPRRSEICIGFSESSGTYSGFPVVFDKNKERVKMISMKLPAKGGDVGSQDIFYPNALTFQVGSNSDYFGFRSTGSGDFKFQVLSDNATPVSQINYANFKNQGEYISPVYKYVKRDDDVAHYEVECLELGIPTEQDLYCKNGQPTDIKIEYVKNKQTLFNVNFFDVHHMADGESIILYDTNISKYFNEKTGKDVDPEDPDPEKTWQSRQCLFALGTADNALTWGTPTIYDLNKNDKKCQFPIMVINSCDYLTSYYNPIGDHFGIILRCYHNDEGTKFLGFLMVNKSALTKEMEMCHYDGDLERKFWYRKLQCLPEHTKRFLTDPNEAYTYGGGILDKEPLKEGVADDFIRVMGSEVTKSCVTDGVDDIDMVTSVLLPTGMATIFYSSPDGIRLLFASQYNSWKRSEIFITYEGSSPFLLGDNFFYTTAEGIAVKYSVLHAIENACLLPENEGNNGEVIESVQKELDDAKPYLIGSGKIDAQRISGHISHDGIYRIFYYNNKNILCCLESKNMLAWEMANNF